MASTNKKTSKKPAAKKSPKASSAKSGASAATKKTAAKQSSSKKAPTKKVAAKKAPAKKAAPTTPATKPAAKKTVSKEKPHFDKKFLDEQKVMLLEERSKYVSSAEGLRAEAEALIEGREPGDVQFDEEGGEGDTLAVERERDLALSALAQKAVDEIDGALERLKDGSYGICTGTGKPIPKERLRAIPWASERVEYKAGGFGTRR